MSSMYERARKDIKIMQNFIKFLLRKENIYKIERQRGKKKEDELSTT